ncbi:hypothetical protein CRUP_003944 [Coryphaenoides rupestris]|nr:hypothetical protein CRUP_003944 [Coryphaenoides rupestris]
MNTRKDTGSMLSVAKDYSGFTVVSGVSEVMRKLQKTYRMEPAGEPGGLGLGRLPVPALIWGSAQLVDHPTLEPRHFVEEKAVNEHYPDYMFLDCIKFINEMKGRNWKSSKPQTPWLPAGSMRLASNLQFKVRMERASGLVRPVSATKLAGRYLAHQEGLPSLPVPALQQTCDRYLTALEPILDPEKLRRTRELVTDFQKAGGLSDWWVQIAYLDYRLPVVIHSSPGLVLPRLEFSDKNAQLRHAAKMIAGVLDFKTQIDNETLPVEYLGQKPLCMNQYYQLLSSCRVPGRRRDSVVNYAKGTRPSTHITVVHNLQFFALEVYDHTGAPLSVDQLHHQLQKLCYVSPRADEEEPVGILTSQHRDVWGRAYQDLIMEEHFHHVPGLRVPSCTNIRRDFILGEDGMCGLIYEHAPAEGPPIVALIDHVVEYALHFNITPGIKRDIEEAIRNLNTMVQELDLTVLVFKHFGKNVPKSFKMSPDAFIQIGLQLAYYRLGRTDTIRSASLDSFNFAKAFDDPGKQKTEKLALMERAIKAHRSYTNMVSPAGEEEDNDDNVASYVLSICVPSHTPPTLSPQAIQGQAIDRHLLGLKLQAIEDGCPYREIYTDPSYATAMHYKISTSQVPAKTDCVMCFGPVVPDGYAVCYNPKEEHINLAVSSFNTSAETDTPRMVQAVEAALLDMRALLETTPKAKI